MIIREQYIKSIRDFYDSDLIKIITGIRRSGKSVLLEQIKEEIESRTDNVLFLNFEDRLVVDSINNYSDLIEYVQKNRKKGKLYLFLDEVQELEGWQIACKTLRLHDVSVFITGSNSKLLSGEFTKELSGRFVTFRVRTFVYKELLEYARQLGKDVSVSDYLIWGGFPSRIEQPNEAAQKRYFNNLFNTIVLNDLIRRYKIRKEPLFVALVNYVLKSNSRIFSAKSIHDYIKQNQSECSINTIMKYLSYLEEAYIIESINQYSTKVKRELAFYKKIYNSDVSLNSLRCQSNRYDLTHNLENIIFNELKYRNYDLTVYDNDGKEIDFLAEKSGKKYFIQVAYSVADDKTYERELGAFRNIDQINRKILITNDDVDYSTSNVQHIKLKNFLLSGDDAF